MKTWHWEIFTVACVLATVNIVISAPWQEWIGAGAVLLSFGHAAVADRLAEKQAKMLRPDIECWRWLCRYFVGKEFLWLIYFILHRSWAALVGVAVFLAYPFWRHHYRRWRPLERERRWT